VKNIQELTQLLNLTILKKADYRFLPLFLLAIMAGIYIALGASFYTVATSGTELTAMTKLIGGGVFSLGLILVVIAGAELFTGNNLMVIGLMNKKITFKQLLRNWTIVYLGNLLGSLIIAALMFYSELYLNSSLGERALNIASMKVNLDFTPAFIRAILCNILVCLAVWLAMVAKSFSGKVLGIIFPISGFVAMGFEHSVANMFFIPIGIFLKLQSTSLSSNYSQLDLTGFFNNLIPVTLGNIVGGVVFVALVYGYLYREDFKSA
jgi:formate/nitrite transporter